jgi:uncharacterized protein YqhQ
LLLEEDQIKKSLFREKRKIVNRLSESDHTQWIDLIIPTAAIALDRHQDWKRIVRVAPAAAVGVLTLKFIATMSNSNNVTPSVEQASQFQFQAKANTHSLIMLLLGLFAQSVKTSVPVSLGSLTTTKQKRRSHSLRLFWAWLQKH